MCWKKSSTIPRVGTLAESVAILMGANHLHLAISLVGCAVVSCATSAKKTLCTVLKPVNWKRYGSVNLSRLRRKDGRKRRPSERVGRILGDFGEFAPGNESRRELFAIE